MSRPLPRHLRDEQVEDFFKVVKGSRDTAMFMLMLRCGLRVEEVANLTMGVIDVKRRTILAKDGKGGKDRIVYMSNDVLQSLAAYLRVRPASRARKNLSVRKGRIQRAAYLHSWHSEAHGTLCPQSKDQIILSSSPAHNGHTDVECRC